MARPGIRLARLRERMRQEKVDLVVLSPGAHMAWLLGLRPHADERPLLACITTENAGILMPALEAESVREQTDQTFHQWSDGDGPVAVFRSMLDELCSENVRCFALDESMRADHAALVMDALPTATPCFSETTVGALRMRKDSEEYAALKANALIADRAMRAAWAGMRPGVTETEVAQVAKDSFVGDGARPLFAIIGAGGNGAFPHHSSGPTTLNPADVVVMDIGGRRDGYTSDITRMAFVGDVPEECFKVHDIVENALQAALSVARPGAKAHEVDDVARAVITEAGFGHQFLHRTGHGLGTEVHEPPYISATSQTVLEEGMVFSIEPGIYIPGRFGVRLEEIIYLRSNGPEVLSELPRHPIRIDV